MYIKLPEELKFENIDNHDYLVNKITNQRFDLQEMVYAVLSERGGSRRPHQSRDGIDFHFKRPEPPYLEYQVNRNGKDPSSQVAFITTSKYAPLTTGYGQHPTLNLFGERKVKVEEERALKKLERQTKDSRSQ